MRQRPMMQTAACLVALVLLGGCAPRDEAPDRSPSASPSDMTPPGLSPSAEPSAPDVVSASARDAAVEVAGAAMRDFTARDRPYDAWWAAFRVHLTPEGVQAYEFTDPGHIPASAVTDAGQFAGGPDGTTAAVLVGTDAGQYRVQLVRQSVEDRWLVDRLTPAEVGS
jgi:hypothetical protein